jgi:hypothetical protein
MIHQKTIGKIGNETYFSHKRSFERKLDLKQTEFLPLFMALKDGMKDDMRL